LARWQALHGHHDRFRRELRIGPDNGRRTQRFRDARAQAHLYLPAIFSDLKPMFGK
jgi:hypothetical protein